MSDRMIALRSRIDRLYVAGSRGPRGIPWLTEEASQ